MRCSHRKIFSMFSHFSTLWNKGQRKLLVFWMNWYLIHTGYYYYYYFFIVTINIHINNVIDSSGLFAVLVSFLMKYHFGLVCRIFWWWWWRTGNWQSYKKWKVTVCYILTVCALIFPTCDVKKGLVTWSSSLWVQVELNIIFLSLLLI